MGMYDNIEDIQVKCFDVPIYHKDNFTRECIGDSSQSGLWFSGGSLRCFNKGQKVPFKTLWYNYSPNFGIYDYSLDFSEENLIIIKNGKVSKIHRNFANIKDTDLKNLNMIIGYGGNPLNIYKVEDFKKYKEDILEYRIILDNLKSKSSFYFKKSFHYKQISKGFRENTEGIILEEAQKLSDVFFEKYKTEANLIEQDEEIAFNTYLAPWKIEESTDDNQIFHLGGLLQCYIDFENRKASGTEINEDDFNYLIFEIKDMLKIENILDSFYKKNNLETPLAEKIKEIIKKINTIPYYKETED